MILEDFVFLGTTVPETSSDGRVMVCSAGYSPELQSLIRIYPLPWRCGVHRWEMYRLPLERNPRDNRPESWKIKCEYRKTDFDLVVNELDKVGAVRNPKDRLAALDQYQVPSIRFLNEERRSLGIIVPQGLSYSFEYDELADDAALMLPGFELPARKQGRRLFPKRPRLQFVDADGQHDLPLNEWGFYEWIRKNPEDYEQVFLNARFGDPTREVRLFVGNFLQHRNSWLVISYLHLAVERQEELALN